MTTVRTSVPTAHAHPWFGQLNVLFLTSTCDTKYASSPVVHKLWYDVTWASLLITLKTSTRTDKQYWTWTENLISLQLTLRTLYTQINIGYRQHWQKKCIKLLLLLCHCNQKCWQIFWNRTAQKSGVSPAFTFIQANMVKLRGAFFFTTFVVNALKWWVGKRE